MEQRTKSERTFHWTNARSPATTVGQALRQRAGHAEYAALEEGIAVLKVTHRGRLTPRIVTMSRDRFALFVTHQTMGRGKGVFSKMTRALPIPLMTRYGVVGFSNKQELREQFVRYLDVADLDFVEYESVGTQKLELARTAHRLKGIDSKVDHDRAHIVTIGHSGNKTIDLLIANAQHRQLLIQCLQQMRAAYHTIRLAVSHEALLLRYIWYDVDVDQTGTISEMEFLKILSRINFNVKHPLQYYREERVKWKKDDTELTYPQVMTLLQELKQKKNNGGMANIIWNQVFGKEQEWVSSQEFLDKFVRTHQGEQQATKDDIERLFSFLNVVETNIYNEPQVMDPSAKINRQRFEVYLHHELNNAYDPCALKTHSDDDALLQEPMSHYWINTSHNTYLTGDQLRSLSSVEMYAKALRRGCKCLELDCYDGEKNKNGIGLPMVYHGHTLTSKLLFADIIRVVLSYVEQNPNALPVILSLENHCSHDVQKQMAADLQSILGDRLFVPKETDHNLVLPSPASLRGKVAIKGKRPPDPDDAPVEDDPDDDDEEEDPYGAISPKRANPTKEEIAKKGKPPKVCKELSSLTLFHGTKYKAFDNSIAEPCSHMHSIGETKIVKIVNRNASHTQQWREYNQSHMTRTYPAGARVDSSNYNPVLAWALGCQLVALNFQTADTPLVLNDGLFAQHGGCGYVLKPETVLLRTFTSATDEKEEATADTIPKQTKTEMAPPKTSEDDTIATILESYQQVMSHMTPTARPLRHFGLRGSERTPLRIGIRILSGSCLPKPKGAKQGESIDPYVAVTVHDVNEKTDKSLTHVVSTHSTPTVQDNGFCPQWNERKETDFTIHSPQVAMIHFSLIEEDIGLDDKVGDAVIPVSYLRPGYRSVHLHDRNATRTGPFTFATLLIHISVK